jgi:Zn2+/Cd2+-exporting ATPase
LKMVDLTANINSNLPPSGTRCTDVLHDILKGYAGIHKVEFDLDNDNLSLTYDPKTLSDQHALAIVHRAGEQALDRVNNCSQREDENCHACLEALKKIISSNNGFQGYYKDAFQVNYKAGVMEINFTSDSPVKSALSRVAKRVFPAIDSSPSTESIPRINREKVEVVFTAINALATLTAYLAGRIGSLSTEGISILFFIAYLAGGYFGMLDGIEVLRRRRLDVNLLMIFAALGAAIIGQPLEGAILLFLFSLSNTLQTYAMDRSRKAIRKLLDLRPSVATVHRGSTLVTVPVDELQHGDIVVVRPGESIPIDGEITSGSSTVDQSAITGESIPIQKGVGDIVFAGTVNGVGALDVRMTHLAKDTTLAKIVQLVEKAQANKAQTQRMLDNFEQYYALFVLGSAALLTIIPFTLLGQEFHSTFYRAMTFLVVASPCALVISTPASILSAIANGARRGILFKGGIHLEQTANIRVVAFDKTGTLTNGCPSLNNIITWNGTSETELLRLAAAVESRSEHPLASAIVKAAEDRQLDLPAATNFRSIAGQGVEANVNGFQVLIGNLKLFSTLEQYIPAEVLSTAQQIEAKGQTVMLVQSDGRWSGLLAVADTVRLNAAQVVSELKELGVERVVMLTGDNQRVAASIASKTGVDEFHPQLLPQDKVDVLKKLRQKYGPIAMVGDGINDAPALASADVGIAMGAAGSDIALETADVVLMADDLTNLPHAIGLSRRARKTVWQNLAFSMGVILVLVASAFGASMPLTIGVLGHEGSTVVVVLNGLRLLGYRR